MNRLADGHDEHHDQILQGITGVHRVGRKGLGHDVPEYGEEIRAVRNAVQEHDGNGAQGDQPARWPAPASRSMHWDRARASLRKRNSAVHGSLVWMMTWLLPLGKLG